MKNVLEKIKDIRKKKGFSHEYIAHELKMSQVSYSKIEKNETKLTLERLYKIAEILDVTVGDILDIEPKNQLHQINRDQSTGYLQKIDAFYQENKEKSERIDQLYDTIIKDKDHIIQQLKMTIESISAK